MKKILMFIVICICTVCYAEEIYNVKMLNGTKWKKVTKSDENNYIIEFSETTINGKISFVRLNKTVNFQWPYYITENSIEEFNKSLVGGSKTGKFLNHYNDKLGDFFSEEILKLNEDSLVLLYKVKEDYVGGSDHTIVYKRIR